MKEALPQLGHVLTRNRVKQTEFSKSIYYNKDKPAAIRSRYWSKCKVSTGVSGFCHDVIDCDGARGTRFIETQLMQCFTYLSTKLLIPGNQKCLKIKCSVFLALIMLMLIVKKPLKGPINDPWECSTRVQEPRRLVSIVGHFGLHTD